MFLYYRNKSCRNSPNSFYFIIFRWFPSLRGAKVQCIYNYSELAALQRKHRIDEVQMKEPADHRGRGPLF